MLRATGRFEIFQLREERRKKKASEESASCRRTKGKVRWTRSKALEARRIV